MKVDPKQIKGRWPNILVGIIITIFSYLAGAAFPPAVGVVAGLGDNTDGTSVPLPSMATESSAVGN